MIDKYISSLINKDIISIYKQQQGKDMLIYLSDTNEIFSSKLFQGYLKKLKTSYIVKPEMPNTQFSKNNYKLVILFDKSTCDADVNNVIANLFVAVQKEKIIYIRPTESYCDSWDNIKKELNKDSAYINYRVVVVDLETEEIICKTKIKCND